MNKENIQKYELIERYINNDLSAEEREAFDTNLKQDPELVKELKAHMEVHEIMIDEGIMKVKEKLKEIHINETNSGNGNLFKNIAFTVLIAGLVSLGLYMYMTEAKKEDKKNATVAESIKKPYTKSSPSFEVAAANVDSGKVTVIAKNIRSSVVSKPDSQTSNVKARRSGDAVGTDTKIIEDVTDNTVPVNSMPVQSDSSANRMVKNEKDQKQNPLPVDCSIIRIKGEATSTESCSGESTGNIIISLNSLSGGTKPYKFSLKEESDFVTGSVFPGLPPGNYKIFIKDKNNCVSLLKNITVSSRNCPKDYVFYPDREQWTLPLKANANGTLKIFDRNGSIVYTSSIVNGYPDMWAGIDNSGQALPSGNYSFIIVYDTNETLEGNVTIAR